MRVWCTGASERLRSGKRRVVRTGYSLVVHAMQRHAVQKECRGICIAMPVCGLARVPVPMVRLIVENPNPSSSAHRTAHIVGMAESCGRWFDS